MHKVNLIAGVAPRALVGTVRGDADAKTILSELNEAFADFKQRNDARLSEIEAALDQTSIANMAARINGVGSFMPTEPKYTEAFASYFRKGLEEATLREANATGYRATVHASMSVGDPSSGGYLAPTEWDRKIQQELLATSPLRRIAQVQSTTVNAYSTLWNNRGFTSGWVGETAARPETVTGTFASLEFAHGEIYANPAISQRLLDDADFDVVQFIASSVSEEFGVEEDLAFISGDGTNKPRGLLTYVTGGAAAGVHPGGNLTVVNTGDASTLGANSSAIVDKLIDFSYGLKSPYRSNGTWLMNSLTAATLAKLKDADGNLIWRESLSVGQPSALLGRPVEIDENMPAVAANAMPIAFGDFKRGYLINDRMGTRVLRDPYTSKPYVHFYTTKRVGGGVLDPKAIRLLKVAL